jgi:hypothetical protein
MRMQLDGEPQRAAEGVHPLSGAICGFVLSINQTAADEARGSESLRRQRFEVHSQPIAPTGRT